MQFKRASLAAALGLGSVVALGVSVNAQSSASAAPCDYSGRHEISIKDLPAGSNAVACKAVGRIITAGGAGVTIPEPGMVAGTSALLASGGDSDFQVHVAKDGTISYPTMPMNPEEQEQPFRLLPLIPGNAQTAHTPRTISRPSKPMTGSSATGDFRAP